VFPYSICLREDDHNGRPLSEPDHLADFGAALAAYICALEIAGECVAEVCPEVGKASSQRIRKLRTRLAFQPTREAIRESTEALRRELKQYAVNASMRVDRRETEFRRGMAAIQEIAESWKRHNEFHASQLQQFTAQLERMEYPIHREEGKAAVALPAATIREYGKTLIRETASAFQRMQEEMAAVEARLAEGQVIDPVTGLLTRDEVLRRVQLLRADEITHTFLVFKIAGQISDAILRQVAAKLGTRFRHQDLVARWAERELLVVFHGVAKLAADRLPHVLAWVSGRYQGDHDQAVDIVVSARVEQPESVAA
jgi:GGDEF domain-containing protein